jgi:hypothetical protein
VEFAIEETMKGQKANRGIISFFSLGAIYEWVLNATPRPLYHRDLMYSSEN